MKTLILIILLLVISTLYLTLTTFYILKSIKIKRLSEFNLEIRVWKIYFNIHIKTRK